MADAYYKILAPSALMLQQQIGAERPFDTEPKPEEWAAVIAKLKADGKLPNDYSEALPRFCPLCGNPFEDPELQCHNCGWPTL